MRIALAVLVLTATPALAQQPCAPSREAMAKVLSDGKYQERAIVSGVTGGAGLVFELWANAATGTWTATLRQANGMTCIVQAGEGFAIVPEAAPTGQEM